MGFVFLGLFALIPASQSLADKMRMYNERSEQKVEYVAPKVEAPKRLTLGVAYGFKIKSIKRDGRLILGAE